MDNWDECNLPEYTQKNLHTTENFVYAEKEMLKYIRPSVALMVLLAIYSLVFATAFIHAALYEVLNGTSLLAYFLYLLGGLLFGWFAFSPLLEYRKMVNFLKENGIYHEAVADFSVAQSFLYDRIRLGNKFIFGKRYCAVLRYSDIRRVYQYVFRRNFWERKRELHAVDNSGKIWHLCKLKVHSEWQSQKNNILDAQLAEVIGFMLNKNRRIAVSYS